MTDSLTPEKRSWNMSRIHSKDTVIEIKIRKFLFSKGFRYRKNFVNLPGKPDTVLKKYKTVVLPPNCQAEKARGFELISTCAGDLYSKAECK